MYRSIHTHLRAVPCAAVALLVTTVLAGCATATYVRDEANDFVAAGEAAIEASSAYYQQINAAQADLVKVILLNHPECPLGDSILIRREISSQARAFAPATVPKLPGEPAAWDCAKEIAANNTANDFCASEGVIACRTEAVAKSRRDTSASFSAEFEYGTPFDTKPLDRKRFAASLALAQVALGYLGILDKIAERPEDAKTFVTRLGGLLDRVNLTACRIDALRDGSDDSKCTAANAGDSNTARAVANVLDDDLKETLNAAASLFDLIAAMRNDAKAAGKIAVTLQTQGAKFEQTLHALIVDLENKRKVYLAQIGMESVEQVRRYWMDMAGKLSAPDRAKVFDQYWTWRSTTEGYMSSPAEPVRLLEQILEAHRELTQLAVHGPQNEQQRAAIAKIQRERLTAFFKVSAKLVSTLGLI